MLYLAQLRGRTGDADEDFFTVKSWVFESGYEGLAEEPGLAARLTTELVELGAAPGTFYIVVEQVERLWAGEDPEVVLARLANAELQRFYGLEEKAEAEISEFDPSWQRPLPIPGIRE